MNLHLQVLIIEELARLEAGRLRRSARHQVTGHNNASAEGHREIWRDRKLKAARESEW